MQSEYRPVQIRRCAIVLIEPRESVTFDFDALLTGGDGTRVVRKLLALAPHLAEPVVIDADDAGILYAIGPTHWQDFEDLATQYPGGRLRRLLDLGLLVADSDSYAPVRARDELLREAHWFAPAAVTHYFGRWQGVASGEAARQAGYSTMSELAEKLGAPPPHVRERVAPELRRALPTAQAGPFDELLRQRVTCRNFDTNEQVPLVAFAQMLRRVFGAQAVHEIQADNIVIKRSSPSGGGLHPTEAYLLVQGVQDVAPGLYHYHAVDHALEPLPLPPGVQLAEFAARMVARQAYFADAPVLVVLASRFPRSFWKYRDHAKAYRVSVLDVGHLSQTLYLSATDLGLGAFITAAINERDIEEAFGLDPLLESPLAVCGFGLRSSTYTHVEFDPLHAIWPKATI